MRQPSPIAKLVTTVVPETVRVAGKPLGRHKLHDPRSRDFPAAQASRVRDVEHAVVGLPLRQHDLHWCGTAHSLVGAINAARRFDRRLDENDAVKIHSIAQLRFPVLDDSGRVVPGGSALAACSAAMSLGWIDGYTHAFGLDHALRALTIRPVLTGIPWYSEFDEPDAGTGLLPVPHQDSVPRGGHQVLVSGIDTASRVVWCWNSWGPEYGLGGRFAMHWELWEQLLERDGDVTVPLA